MKIYRREPWDNEDPTAVARGIRNLLILWAAVVLLLWLLG